MKRKKVIMARKIKLGEDDGMFDLIFWMKVGVAGTLEATVQMVEDHYKFGGPHAHSPRLRRDVAALKRRRG